MSAIWPVLVWHDFVGSDRLEYGTAVWDAAGLGEEWRETRYI